MISIGLSLCVCSYIWVGLKCSIFSKPSRFREMFYSSPKEFSITFVTDNGVRSIFMYLLLVGSNNSVIIFKYMSIQSVKSLDFINQSWLFLAYESLKRSEIKVLWMWHSFSDSYLESWTPNVEAGNSSKGKVVRAFKWL